MVAIGIGHLQSSVTQASKQTEEHTTGDAVRRRDGV
jgi:hypothetical protein